MSGTGHYDHYDHHHLTPVEQHLGDRLSAFIDGELRDDARDRVLSHLATCPGCKDAAEEQRRLKNAVAAADLPALSAGFLARLRELPGGDDEQRPGPFDDAPDGPDIMGTASLGGERLDGGLFGGFGRWRGEHFSLPPTPRGFRIHQVAATAASSSAGSSLSSSASSSTAPSSSTLLTVPPATASPWSTRRGRRLAFAAAGAFSMAAIALGGALPLDGAVDGPSEDLGPSASPQAVNANATADLADLWSGAGSLNRAPGELPGRGESLPLASAMTTLSASSRALSAPGTNASTNAGTGSGSGANVPSGGSAVAAPSPQLSRSTLPLIALAEPSPSPPSPAAPLDPAPVDTLLPMLGGVARTTR